MARRARIGFGWIFCLIAVASTRTDAQAADPSELNAKFIEAAAAGKLTEVQSLLAQGAQINAVDVIGDTALHSAALECHLDVVEFLAGVPGVQLDRQGSAGDVPMGEAASAGCLRVVTALVERNADLNAINNNRQTPLWRAASLDRIDVVEYLAGRSNIQLNAAESSNISPLWIAASGGADGYLDVVKCLVSHRANLELAGGYDRSTALGEAAATGHLAVVKFLVDSGANRDARNGAGATPSDAACTAWAGLPPEDGGGPCPRAEILRALRR
ncbi:MAG: ankyrin repeat domain-containing protein [Elusimicrobiota bacterium]